MIIVASVAASEEARHEDGKPAVTVRGSDDDDLPVLLDDGCLRLLGRPRPGPEIIRIGLDLDGARTFPTQPPATSVPSGRSSADAAMAPPENAVCADPSFPNDVSS